MPLMSAHYDGVNLYSQNQKCADSGEFSQRHRRTSVDSKREDVCIRTV